MEISTDSSDGRKEIEGNFNKEFYMESSDLSDFLKDLSEEIKEGNELKLKSDDWVLPFKFSDKVEVEIEKDHDELEIELEFNKPKDTEELSLE